MRYMTFRAVKYTFDVEGSLSDDASAGFSLMFRHPLNKNQDDYICDTYCGNPIQKTGMFDWMQWRKAFPENGWLQSSKLMYKEGKFNTIFKDPLLRENIPGRKTSFKGDGYATLHLSPVMEAMDDFVAEAVSLQPELNGWPEANGVFEREFDRGFDGLKYEDEDEDKCLDVDSFCDNVRPKCTAEAYADSDPCHFCVGDRDRTELHKAARNSKLSCPLGIDCGYACFPKDDERVQGACFPEATPTSRGRKKRERKRCTPESFYRYPPYPEKIKRSKSRSSKLLDLFTRPTFNAKISRLLGHVSRLTTLAILSSSTQFEIVTGFLKPAKIPGYGSSENVPRDFLKLVSAIHVSRIAGELFTCYKAKVLTLVDCGVQIFGPHMKLARDRVFRDIMRWEVWKKSVSNEAPLSDAEGLSRELDLMNACLMYIQRSQGFRDNVPPQYEYKVEQDVLYENNCQRPDADPKEKVASAACTETGDRHQKTQEDEYEYERMSGAPYNVAMRVCFKKTNQDECESDEVKVEDSKPIPVCRWYESMMSSSSSSLEKIFTMFSPTTPTYRTTATHAMLHRGCFVSPEYSRLWNFDYSLGVKWAGDELILSNKMTPRERLFISNSYVPLEEGRLVSAQENTFGRPVSRLFMFDDAITGLELSLRFKFEIKIPRDRKDDESCVSEDLTIPFESTLGVFWRSAAYNDVYRTCPTYMQNLNKLIKLHNGDAYGRRILKNEKGFQLHKAWKALDRYIGEKRGSKPASHTSGQGIRARGAPTGVEEWLEKETESMSGSTKVPVFSILAQFRAFDCTVKQLICLINKVDPGFEVSSLSGGASGGSDACDTFIDKLLTITGLEGAEKEFIKWLSTLLDSGVSQTRIVYTNHYYGKENSKENTDGPDVVVKFDQEKEDIVNIDGDEDSDGKEDVEKSGYQKRLNNMISQVTILKNSVFVCFFEVPTFFTNYGIPSYFPVRTKALPVLYLCLCPFVCSGCQAFVDLTSFRNNGHIECILILGMYS